MKKILLSILALILFLNMVYAADLSTYPNIFVKDKKFDGLFIVGDNAPAEDVISVSDIISSFSQNGVSTGVAKLSKEVTDVYKQNVIVVGNACTNPTAAQLLGNPSGCFPDLDENQGIIKLANNNGYYQLLVSGSTPLGTRNAASVLSNFKSYNLQGSDIYITKNSQNEYNLKYHFDLSSFPNMFVKEGDLNALIVVGDKASSSDVIAQSNLILFFGKYLDRQIKGAAKLSSETASLNQNIISIGNPCNNPISAQIMNYPNPCDKDFKSGKAVIRIYNYNPYVYIVAAGYSNKGSKEATDVLINYDKYNLNGNEFLIEVQEVPTIVKEQQKDEVADKEIIDKKEITAEDARQKIIEELNKKIANKSKEEIKEDEGKTEAINSKKNESVLSKSQETQNKQENTIIRILNWFKRLFRK